MATRHLINEDGSPFNSGELDGLIDEFNSLNADERKNFRNDNAATIANHAANQILIVAGPGTGKSTLFKQRIRFWLEETAAAKILALSFVRKLVADLDADIQNDKDLSDKQKKQVQVSTLHKYARSIVEQNHGTREWKFVPHFQIISPLWTEVVWRDALLIAGQKDHSRLSFKAFETQIHDDNFDNSDEWVALKESYLTLCRFYNAAAFSDLILRAKEALAENPKLNQNEFFIIDEYQDFNAAEENLLVQIAEGTSGKLIVGDDDQVLYETLKSGKASLIRAIYNDSEVANAMLPFCGRCDFHITQAADHFIKQTPDPASIKKIYLPMSGDDDSTKIQAVVCATPTTAVDYIRKFIAEHQKEIDQRKKELVDGKSKDAFLLILSPSRAVRFYGNATEELRTLLEPFTDESVKYSDDYHKVLNYYALANYPLNNFTFRKVLHHEGLNENDLLALLETCFAEEKPFASLDTLSTKGALNKASGVKGVLEASSSVGQKVDALTKLIGVSDQISLRKDLKRAAIDKARIDAIEHQNEEEA